MWHHRRRVHVVLPLCPDRPGRGRSRAVLGPRPLPGRDVRAGDPALRAGRDRVVRDGGIVSAASLVGVALGSVVQGRCVDRLGPTRPLLVAAALFAVAVSGLFVAVENRVPLVVLVASAALAGAVQPALPGASRALWGRLIPPGAGRAAAYNYEAISMEVFF